MLPENPFLHFLQFKNETTIMGPRMKFKFIWYGGRVKVDFFKVDTRFWRVDLGQNWKLHLRLTCFY